MRRIINAIRNAIAPRTVYVVCRSKYGENITNVEVYTDHDRAQARQQALGVGDTCYAERLVDDDRWERRPTVKRVRGQAVA